jgi:hypothetical protein
LRYTAAAELTDTGIEESNLASWQDRAVETSFKPSEGGGYVFQCPNPWLFGRMRNYLVNEAQKQQLAACLRQRQRLILWLMAIYVLIALGLTSLLQSMNPPPDPSSFGFFAVMALTILVMFGLAMVPHLFLMRKIRPLLGELQTTDQAITLREQIFGVAAVISNMHLVLGGLGGFMVAVGSIKTIVEELHGVEGSLYWSGFGLLAGTSFMSYFAYLAILKRRLKRKAK